MPSEAEWEYAARGGSTTRWFWGEDSKRACEFANVGDESVKQEHPDWPRQAATMDSQKRIDRDGGWYNKPEAVRSALRYAGDDPRRRNNTLDFEWSERCRKISRAHHRL